MKQFFLSLLALSIYCSIIAQKKPEILLTIGDTEITSNEFIRVYSKNNNTSNDIDAKTVDEYIDLFINYKLKVLEAKNRKMDSIPAFQEEYNKYKEQLAKSYLTDTNIDKEILQEAYYRTTHEVNASHIMVMLKEDAAPKDTLIAYNKIMSIRDSILNGGDFEKIAHEMSEDPSAKGNNGNLGYFSAFRMVYPFECAAYNTPVSEVSMPVRSKFGYHLIKVNDKRESQGEITVKHIMILNPATSTQEEKDSAKAKIDVIYKKILDGEDFNDLAFKYSEDRNSAGKAGRLNPFSAGQMIPVFEKAAFALKNDGDVSEPIQTKYGWHIIKRVKISPIASFEELKPELEAKINRHGLTEVSFDKYIGKLKKEYNFKKNEESLAYFYELLDSTFFSPDWSLDPDLDLNKPLFTFSDQVVTQQEFANFLIANNTNKPTAIEPYVDKAFNNFSAVRIYAYEKEHLEEKFPEFKHLSQEYYEGILLFNLMDSMVWSKTIKDTTGFKNFYEENIDNYMWDERAKLAYISYDSTVNKDSLKLYLEVALSDSTDISSLNEKFCDSTNLKCLNIKEQTLEKGDIKIPEEIEWKKGIYETPNEQVIVVRNILSPAPKKLYEVRGVVASDYQNYLEENWIKDLRAKYPISMNEKAFKKVKKKVKSKK